MSVGDSDRSAHDPPSPWDSVDDEDLEDDQGVPSRASTPTERAPVVPNPPLQGLSPQKPRLSGSGSGLGGRGAPFRNSAMTPSAFADVPATDVEDESGVDLMPATDVDRTPDLVADPVDVLAAELASSTPPGIPPVSELSLPSLPSIPSLGPAVRPSAAAPPQVEPETQRDVVPAPEVGVVDPTDQVPGLGAARMVGEREQMQSWPTLPQTTSAPPEASPLPPPPRSGQQAAQAPPEARAASPFDALDGALLTPSPHMRSSSAVGEETQLVNYVTRRVSWQVIAVCSAAALLIGLATGFVLWGRQRPAAAPAPQAGATTPATGDAAAGAADTRARALAPPNPATGGADGPDTAAATDAGVPADDADAAPVALAADAAPAAPRSTGVCAVSLVSVPSRAQVLAGDEVLGQTPMRTKLPCGSVALTFRRARYAPYKHSAELTDDSPNKVEARLERPEFKLSISSQPPGATVTLDGKDVGETPVSISAAGFTNHVLVVTKSGHRTYRNKRLYLRKDASVNARLSRRR